MGRIRSRATRRRRLAIGLAVAAAVMAADELLAVSLVSNHPLGAAMVGAGGLLGFIGLIAWNLPEIRER